MKRILLAAIAIFFSFSLQAIDDKCCPAPYDKEMKCTALPYDFDPHNVYQLQDLFGFTGKSGCKSFHVHELKPTVKLNSCNIGTIIRRFEVDPDGYGNKFICEQKVTLVGQHHYAIEFPEDASANCSVPYANSVKFHQFDCDLLTVNVNDEKFRASGDECYKVFRTYRVINWCEFDDENSRPIVIGRDEDCDGWSGDEPVFVIRKEDGTVFIDRDKESYNHNPPLSEIDESCGHDGYRGYWRSFSIAEGSSYYKRRGYWQYTQVIKVFDRTQPELHIGEFDAFCTYQNDNPCTGRATIPFNISENCTPDDIEIRVFFYENKVPVETAGANNISEQVLTGSFPNYELIGNFEIGTHEMLIQVSDGCGATASQVVPFEIKDCLAPTPICLEALNVKMSPDYDEENNHQGGYFELWATDFLASETKNDCTSPISYSIHRKLSIDSGEETPDPAQQKILLDCEDLPVVMVYIYAWDQAGNSDHCQAFVWLQDDNYHCDSPYSDISGFIHTESGAGVADVQIDLSGGHETSVLTNDQGRFRIDNLEPGNDYTISLTKDDPITNGVSTLDLVLISRHILGIETLDSPYKLVAADINQSQSITTADLIHLRKAILRIDKSFSNNNSWRFIPMTYEFPDSVFALNQAFPEVANFNNIDSTGVDIDFMAVKVGDVSEDAVANNNGFVKPRFQGDIDLIATRQADHPDRIDFKFDLSQAQSLIGAQFTLEFDPNKVQIESIEYSQMVQPYNFNEVYLKEGWFSFSWFGEPVSASDPLFTLKVDSKAILPIAQAFSITSSQTESIAYDVDQKPLNIHLTFEADFQSQVELYQNTPNPFKEVTFIPFYLPSDGQVSLEVFTTEGKLVKQINQFYAQGRHQIELSRDQLPKGLLLYQLTVGSTTKIRKMLIQ